MLEDTVFRIVQECLNNARRHSKSKRVKVELRHHGEQLRIEVRDWGVGFKLGGVGDGHFGLEGIQERAKIFGGRAVIASGLRKGTVIVVELPCHRSEPALEKARSKRFVQWLGTMPSKVHIASNLQRTLCGRPSPGNATETALPPQDKATICKACRKIEQAKPFQ